MLPDRVSNPGPLTYESGALPIALRGPAGTGILIESMMELRPRLIESMIGLRPRQRNLRLVYRLFSLMRGLPSIRLK